MTIKKVELHVHLDGSLKPSLYSKIKNISESDAKNILIAKPKCHDLNDYLTKFSEPVSVMQSRESLYLVASSLCNDLLEDNCIYAEIRFAPNKHTSVLSLDEVVDSVLKGMRSTKLKSNILLCLMRGDSKEDNKKVIDLAYKYLNKGVVGIDLAGAEKIYPTRDYEELFAYAASQGIPFTIHAGEASGPRSIMDAIEFGAKRIGHGVRALESQECLNLIKEKNITLEVCPTSNIQTNIYDDIKSHPLKKLYDMGINVCINTDNRTVSNVTLSQEYVNVQRELLLTNEELYNMNVMAIEASFLSFNEKQELLNELNSE